MTQPRSSLRTGTSLTPLRIASDAETLAMLGQVPAGTDERALPLAMRGGLMGVFGFGPNPARDHLEKLEGNDDQR